MDTVSTTTDHAIVAAVLAGDYAQFEEIVTRYQPALLRVSTSRLGNRSRAEDVVQETFLRAYKSLATFKPEYSFRTWLWTILLNQCSRALQKQARFPQSNVWEAGAAEIDRSLDAGTGWFNGSETAPPLVLLLQKERAEVLDQLLDELSAAQGDALRLRFFGGLKFQEIADTMQCSLSSAKQRVRHGLLQLNQKIQAKPARRDVCAPDEDNAQ